MIELNLLPDVKLQYVHAQKSRMRAISIVSIGSIVAVGLVVLFAIYVYAVQPGRGYFIDKDIVKYNNELESITGLNDYLTIQQQLDALPELHAGKPIYSRIIGYLPILNPSPPNNMRVTQLRIDSDAGAEELTIQGQAPSYTAVTVFESTLKSALFNYMLDGEVQEPAILFSAVTVTDTSLGVDTNGNKIANFTVTLKVNENVFAFDTTNASISVPNKDATKSAQNVPEEVFADTSVGGEQ